MPLFVGPYRVNKASPDTSHYQLNLPDELADRQIHPTFHVSKLRAHEPNDDIAFPKRDTKFFYDFGAPDENEWLVRAILDHRWIGKRVEFKVDWTDGDETWEPYDNCKHLLALTEYLELQGTTDWKRLSRKG